MSIICAFVFLLSPSSLWLFGRKPVGRKAIENMEKKERERIEERQARIDNVMAVRQGRKEGGREKGGYNDILGFGYGEWGVGNGFSFVVVAAASAASGVTALTGGCCSRSRATVNWSLSKRSRGVGGRDRKRGRGERKRQTDRQT